MSGNELADAFDEIDALEIPIQEQDCPCGSHWSFNDCCGQAVGEEELEEALLHLFRRHPATTRLSELETIHLVEAATGLIWSGGRLPMHGNPEPEGDELTSAELYAVADRYQLGCRYCDGSQHFYSEPDLGPCVCAPGEELDVESLIG